MMDTQEVRPEYLVTGDVALVIGSGRKRFLAVIKSTKAFLAGKYVIPGGHRTRDDKTVAHTAANEAFQEIGLVLDPETLEDHLFMTLSGLDRDLRPKYRKGDAPDKDKMIDRFTVVFLVEFDSAPAGLKAGDDAASIHFVALEELTEEMMGYDHWLVVKKLQKRYGIK